jgi:hypothetical protein
VDVFARFFAFRRLACFYVGCGRTQPGRNRLKAGYELALDCVWHWVVCFCDFRGCDDECAELHVRGPSVVLGTSGFFWLLIPQPERAERNSRNALVVVTKIPI